MWKKSEASPFIDLESATIKNPNILWFAEFTGFFSNLLSSFDKDFDFKSTDQRWLRLAWCEFVLLERKLNKEIASQDKKNNPEQDSQYLNNGPEAGLLKKVDQFLEKLEEQSGMPSKIDREKYTRWVSGLFSDQKDLKERSRMTVDALAFPGFSMRDWLFEMHGL